MGRQRFRRGRRPKGGPGYGHGGGYSGGPGGYSGGGYGNPNYGGPGDSGPGDGREFQGGYGGNYQGQQYPDRGGYGAPQNPQQGGGFPGYDPTMGYGNNAGYGDTSGYGDPGLWGAPPGVDPRAAVPPGTQVPREGADDEGSSEEDSDSNENTTGRSNGPGPSSPYDARYEGTPGAPPRPQVPQQNMGRPEGVRPDGMRPDQQRPGYPPQNYPPQNYPPQNYPPQNYPQHHNNPPQYPNQPRFEGGGGYGNDGFEQRGGRFGRFQRPGRFGGPTQGVSVEETTVQGIVELQKEGTAYLRFPRNDMLPGPDDVFVANHLVRRFDLRDGSLVEGPIEPPRRPGQRPGLADVTKVDGMEPDEAAKLPRFTELTVIDPDFHYELGDAGDISLRVLDLLCPVGRGQRGLIVAPPRTGKTVFLNKVAQAMERLYPDVHLMVLLVDERPEEGTMWKRLVKGDVFLSTLDQGTKNHVALSEAVFRRATRLVECKKDVILLLDSITRMSRAYNAETGNSGRILTGGIDSRTMEKPKRMFGAARNTEGGGALTILGTTLVDTGSKMDQVIFEEFKGTGNMELVLSRPLADRRIFPAFDIGLSGTRKEEKLLSPAKARRIVTLRRVLQKMKPIEAMEQLLLKLERTPNNEEFLRQFELSGAD